jgi:hypothetical protein
MLTSATIHDYKNLAIALYRKLRNKPLAGITTIKKEFPKFDGRKKDHWILLVAKLLNRKADFSPKASKTEIANRILNKIKSALFDNYAVSYGNAEIFLGCLTLRFTIKNNIRGLGELTITVNTNDFNDIRYCFKPSWFETKCESVDQLLKAVTQKIKLAQKPYQFQNANNKVA